MMNRKVTKHFKRYFGGMVDNQVPPVVFEDVYRRTEKREFKRRKTEFIPNLVFHMGLAALLVFLLLPFNPSGVMNDRLERIYDEYKLEQKIPEAVDDIITLLKYKHKRNVDHEKKTMPPGRNPLFLRAFAAKKEVKNEKI